MEKKPLVLNFFGGPGSGKSTAAAYVFSKLKLAGYNVELVTEVAKDFTWDGALEILKDQIYIFGEQQHRFFRCADKVDLIITDSPMFLTTIYNHDETIQASLNTLVLDVINKYENINIFLKRVKPYNPIGRNQTEEESDEISERIKAALKDVGISFSTLEGSTAGYEKAYHIVLELLEQNKNS